MIDPLHRVVSGLLGICFFFSFGVLRAGATEAGVDQIYQPIIAGDVHGAEDGVVLLPVLFLQWNHRGKVPYDAINMPRTVLTNAPRSVWMEDYNLLSRTGVRIIRSGDYEYEPEKKNQVGLHVSEFCSEGVAKGLTVERVAEIALECIRRSAQVRGDKERPNLTIYGKKGDEGKWREWEEAFNSHDFSKPFRMTVVRGQKAPVFPNFRKPNRVIYQAVVAYDESLRAQAPKGYMALPVVFQDWSGRENIYWSISNPQPMLTDEDRSWMDRDINLLSQVHVDIAGMPQQAFVNFGDWSPPKYMEEFSVETVVEAALECIRLTFLASGRKERPVVSIGGKKEDAAKWGEVADRFNQHDWSKPFVLTGSLVSP